ncbi:4-(cytidine 5'-diphospho)-2-C-methyl-D-erythritol kinase [Natronospora cellulosivora (SeqCode)]
MHKITVPAPAKINLALDILAKRDDGFHEVEMIMQSVSLHDVVEIEKNSRGIYLEVDNSDLPSDENNIAYRAAELILEAAGISAGIKINIKKNIPIAAGLAGGSSDAAAVLTGINILYDLNLSKNDLFSLASKLGSDVAFCIDGGTALAYGRGELIKQLPDLEDAFIIIVNPGIKVSTAWAYKEYDSLHNTERVDTDKLIKLLVEKKDITWREGWKNVMEKAVLPVYQEISDIKDILLDMGAIFSMMSGSGSSVFAIVREKEIAEYIYSMWPRKSDFIVISKTVRKGFLELWKNNFC